MGKQQKQQVPVFGLVSDDQVPEPLGEPPRKAWTWKLPQLFELMGPSYLQNWVVLGVNVGKGYQSHWASGIFSDNPSSKTLNLATIFVSEWLCNMQTSTSNLLFRSLELIRIWDVHSLTPWVWNNFFSHQEVKLHPRPKPSSAGRAKWRTGDFPPRKSNIDTKNIQKMMGFQNVSPFKYGYFWVSMLVFRV